MKDQEAGKSDEPRLLHSGEEFFARLEELISAAHYDIYLQTYIFLDDHAGRRIASAMCQAARRGVKVFALLDAYGSRPLSDELEKKMIDAGVQLRFFARLFSWNTLYIGRRLHHKVFVADSEIAVLGGINIADHYLGTEKELAWLDYAVELRGETAKEMHDICDALHHRKKQRSRHIATNAEVRLLRNDWLKRKTAIQNTYLSHFKAAKEEIFIIGAYFFPGRRLSRTLVNAAKRGVKVNVILAGVSDVPFIRFASRYLYSRFIRHHIMLYEYQKSVLHGKAAICDKNWCTVGSYNLNSLSSYGSLEMNAGISDKAFIQNFYEEFREVLKDCELANVKRPHNVFEKFVYFLCYLIIAASSGFMTFFSYRRFFRHFRPD